MLDRIWRRRGKTTTAPSQPSPVPTAPPLPLKQEEAVHAAAARFRAMLAALPRDQQFRCLENDARYIILVIETLGLLPKESADA